MERMIRTLAVETLRLQRLAERMPADSTHVMALRHSLRRLRAELDGHGVSFLDLTGQPYDPGMSLEVLDTLGEGEILNIAEMRQPVILWEGRLLASGEVILQATRADKPEPRPAVAPAWQARLSQKRNHRRQARRRKRTHILTGETA